MEAPIVQTRYLLTGANRGLGRAIAAALLQRDNIALVATVRDPSVEEAQSLLNLPAGSGSKIIVLPLNMRDEPGPATLLPALAEKGIGHLDVVIANAGICKTFKNVVETDPEDFREHYEVNTIGTMKLFQTLWPLLAKGRGKKFVFISSMLGSFNLIEIGHGMPAPSYSASKVATNWLMRKIHDEHREDGLLVGILHPGWFDTDMGSRLADSMGMAAAPQKIEDVTASTLKNIDELSEATSGKFVNFDGTVLGW